MLEMLVDVQEPTGFIRMCWRGNSSPLSYIIAQNVMRFESNTRGYIKIDEIDLIFIICLPTTEKCLLSGGSGRKSVLVFAANACFSLCVTE